MSRVQDFLVQAMQARTFSPDWTVHPGEVLGETIEELGTTQAEVARHMGISLKHLNQIIKGKAGITAEIAVLLEQETSVSARFWLSLDMEHRLFLARRAYYESSLGKKGGADCDD